MFRRRTGASGPTVQLRNFFLSAMKANDLAALSPALTEVAVSTGQVLFEAGETVDLLYFPSTACISLVISMQDGKSVETSTVGCESVVSLMDGITLQPSQTRVIAQIGGAAARLPAATFRARLLQSPDLVSLTLLHARATALQTEQGVACNITHSAQSRLARWLLMTQDRVGAATFALTQEYMAVMTGVQRTTVSELASALKRAGAIDYSRGRVKVLDRDALLDHACECYGVVGRQFEELRERSENRRSLWPLAGRIA